MKVVTKQFGELEFSKDAVIKFANGLLGFEKFRHYVLLEHSEYHPFRWLISTENENISFAVLDPLLVQPEFAKELPKRLVDRLFDAKSTSDIFAIVNFRENGGPTINLKSPIVIDRQEMCGEQLVLISEQLPVAKALA